MLAAVRDVCSVSGSARGARPMSRWSRHSQAASGEGPVLGPVVLP